MPLTIRGYAALQEKAPLEPYQFVRRDPRSNDVVIDILYCGVCHSDYHHVQNDWGRAMYPIVPGHEIIGRVTSVGHAVTKFKMGELVGVGCMVDSCQHCGPCKHGHEQYCEQIPTYTYNSIDPHDQMKTFGGYSESIVVSEKFVLKVPENLNVAATAPLLCAGITTWSPLRHWNIGPDSKVAVIGLGGLGHMALKLAHALGAQVTLFTRSRDKEADAKRLGVNNIVLSTIPDEMVKVKNHFDLIIDTVPYVHDINPYMSTLAINGTLVLVGYLGPLDPFVNSVALIAGRRSVAGSLIGGIAETQELLDFCGKHHITSDVEVVSIQDINLAFQRMLKSDVKYRFVIDMSTLKKGA